MDRTNFGNFVVDWQYVHRDAGNQGYADGGAGYQVYDENVPPPPPPGTPPLPPQVGGEQPQWIALDGAQGQQEQQDGQGQQEQQIGQEQQGQQEQGQDQMAQVQEHPEGNPEPAQQEQDDESKYVNWESKNVPTEKEMLDRALEQWGLTPSYDIY